MNCEEECPKYEILHNSNMRLSKEIHDAHGKLLKQDIMITDATNLLIRCQRYMKYFEGIESDSIADETEKWLQKRQEMK